MNPRTLARLREQAADPAVEGEDADELSTS